MEADVQSLGFSLGLCALSEGPQFVGVQVLAGIALSLHITFLEHDGWGCALPTCLVWIEEALNTWYFFQKLQ